ncbi:MAG: ATP-binding protein [Prochloraceae cyanobacterium]|nr:ATP-binding protein [Prochloraceae cyanobacterium]
MKVFLWNSLRLRMPLVVLGGVIPLILGAIFYASDRASKTIRTEAMENVRLKGDLLAEAVSSWNESNVLALTNLSEQPDIVTMKPETQKPVLATLVKNYDHFYLAMTIKPDGRNLARNDNKKLKYYGDRNYFQNAIKGNKISSQAIISRTVKKPASCLSTPIRQKESIIGVAAICTDLETLSKQVGQLKFGKTGYALVVDDKGMVLAHPDPKFVSGEKLNDLSHYPPVKNFLSGNNSELTSFTNSSSGIDWISYSTRLDNGWGVVVLQEKEEFLNSETEFQRLAFFLAAVTVLGVSVLTWLLANRLIEPLTNLSEAAQSISEGQLDLKVEFKRSDELGILANSFNQMATNLKTSFDKLKERTVELEEAKEAAEAANQAKDNFLINISHELRTPLNSILGYTQMLLRAPNLDRSQQLDLRIVKQSGNHLLTLINDILDFSKTRADKMELSLSQLDLLPFLSEIVGMFQGGADEKGISLRYESVGELPKGIIADSKRLRQVLLNLLGNAVKFTEFGEVIFKVSLVGNLAKSNVANPKTIRFEVIDTGIGMNKDVLEKIFQPFEQAGNNTNRSKGTGLGLSISQKLVELMGSKIQVSSQLGRGSTFWFDVAFDVVEIKVDKQIQLERNPSQILGYKGNTRQILIIDDRAENRDLLLKILKPLGFELAEATNGQEGLEIAISMKPDIILTDLLMPYKTGVTMVSDLRQIPELKDTPVIALSASTLEIMEKKSLSVGCNLFLPKPIDEEKLLAYLQEFLNLEWVYQGSFDKPEKIWHS